jgi:hypothetical protein
MSFRSRLARLEQAFGNGACGPDCPPQAVVRYVQDGPDAEPVLEEGQEPPAPCPRCGRPADVLPLVLLFDRDFYGNAERLGGMTT